MPYDSSGKLIEDKDLGKPGKKPQDWNLRTGAAVKLTAGPGRGYVGKVIGKNSEGHYRIRLPLQRQGHKEQGLRWSTYILGKWWLETAVNGKAPLLPVVNTSEKPALLKEWSCPQCTFLNTGMTCEMCTAERPSVAQS